MGCAESKEVTAERIVEGLKAALALAVDKTVEQLGAAGGFNKNDALHIKIPGTLGDVIENVRKMPFMGDFGGGLEEKLNEAAEAAAGSCADIFKNALPSLNFNDARAILDGADNAATGLFKEVLGGELLERFTPIVKEKMQEVGAIGLFETIQEKLESLPGMSKIDLDLYAYVTDKAFNSFFEILAHWEGAVRTTPEMQRTSQAMEEAFGARKQK